MNADLQKKLYFEMLRIRLIEERIADLYPRQQMRCPVHLSIGQEAVAAGVCAHLRREDYVLSGHRSHSHYLAKGGDLKRMMAELYGKETGCARGKGGSMHLVDLDAGFLGATPIVGSTIPIAAGAAMGLAMQGERRVVVVFFGEAATEEGVFHETVNFAVLRKLGIVFVCENNLYSVYSPLSVRQPAGRRISELVRGYGIESAEGDGNDVEEVHHLAGPAVERARSGGGPSFLEFKTYRWREHCGPNYDNDLGYRTEAEFLEWKARCPVARAERAMAPGEVEKMKASIAAEIGEAVAFAEKSPFPAPSELMKDVYG